MMMKKMKMEIEMSHDALSNTALVRRFEFPDTLMRLSTVKLSRQSEYTFLQIFFSPQIHVYISDLSNTNKKVIGSKAPTNNPQPPFLNHRRLPRNLRLHGSQTHPSPRHSRKAKRTDPLPRESGRQSSCTTNRFICCPREGS